METKDTNDIKETKEINDINDIKEINDINETKVTKEKNTVSQTLGIFGKTIGWLIIIFLIVILIRALVFKKYDVFGYRFYLIMSGSMEPTIQVSDAVITKEVSELKDGDIIAFQYHGTTTVHRIVKTYTEKDEKLYQTKGDNNNTVDKGLVNKTLIKGKVIFKIPNVGKAILFLQNNLVIILILIVGIFIIIILVRRLI